MNSLMMILTFTRMFFFLNLFSLFSAEYINYNPDLKLAFQKIEQLQKIMLTQDEQIAMLEKRPPESEIQTVTKLQNTVKQQGDEIAHLKARMQELETIISATYDDIPGKDGPLSEANDEITVSSNKPFIRKGRLLHIQPTTVPVDLVAFYAYLSSDTPASVAHRIILFDTVITNEGNAYHPHMGTFIAPRDGLYVFTWMIRLNGNAYFTTELVVNNIVVNWIYFGTHNNIDGSVTGTAVVHVNQGDDVLIRTGPTYHSGSIISNNDGKSSFAGWILV